MDGHARGRRAFLEWLTSGGSSSKNGTASTGSSGDGAGATAAAAGTAPPAAGSGTQGSLTQNWLALLRLMNMPADSLAHLSELTVADVETVGCGWCIGLDWVVGGRVEGWIGWIDRSICPC